MPRTQTIQGETFDLLALRLGGRETDMIEVLKKNPGLAKTVFFSSGGEIETPEIKTRRTYTKPYWQEAESA